MGKNVEFIKERYQRNGSNDRVNVLLSSAILLLYEADNLIGEAEDIIKANGLVMGTLKMTLKNYHLAATRVYNEFGDLTNSKGSSMEVLSDLDKFDDAIRKMMKIEPFKLILNGNIDKDNNQQ